MTPHSDDTPHPGQGNAPELPVSALIAAIREVTDKRGLSLQAVARRIGLGGLLVRAELGQLSEGELSVGDIAALGKELGVSASDLIARAEALAREQREQ